MKKQTTTFPDIKKGLDDTGYPSMNARGEEAVSRELYDGVKHIKGKVAKQFVYPDPSKFHVRLMKKGILKLGSKTEYTYPDLKVRNDMEYRFNKKVFLPTELNVEALLYHYDKLYQLTHYLQNKVASLKEDLFILRNRE
tara:strand:+ start:1051 stop:1467 length:417 start_codon:yes stop_codon:yes gene_type:complete